MRSAVLCLAASILVFSTWTCPGPAAAHEEAKGGGQVTPGPSAPLGFSACVNGLAGGYPCSNVDLLSFLPHSAIGGGAGNTVWGWTDPLTHKEYALVGRTTGTAFVDISNPQQPVYLGDLPTRTVESIWRDIKVYQNYAFIVSEAFGHGVQIFDLTKLRTVTNPPVTFTQNQTYGAFNTHTLALNEQTGFAYACGTATCNGGLHIIDVHNPLAPVMAGCFPDDGYTHETQCVVYNGPDSAYRGKEICFNANEDTLTIVDVTTKSALRLVSRTGYTGYGYMHQGWLSDDHAYFFADDELDEINYHHNTRTYVWDVSDLDAPRIVGSYTAATAAIDHNQYVRGDYIFQSNYRAGLRILHINDAATANLTQTAFFDIYPTDDNPNFNAAWSNYPFFASGVVLINGIEQGLFVVQPHLPSTPIPTPTATSIPSTPTPGGRGISGHVHYYSNGEPVEGATMALDGASPSSITTDTTGAFVFSNLSAGNWRVTPYMAGDLGNAVSALDAVYVLQAVVHARTLNSSQQAACDVTGNGGLSALDASLILQHKVTLITTFPTACGDWLFVPSPAPTPGQQTQPPLNSPSSCTPGAITFPALNGLAANQDFSAVALGDCTGNWQPDPAGTSAALSATLAPPSAVRVGRVRRDGHGRLLVPLYADAAEPFNALEVHLRHDPRSHVVRVLRPRWLSGSLVAFNARQPELLSIALASPAPLDSQGRPILWVQLTGSGPVLARGATLRVSD